MTARCIRTTMISLIGSSLLLAACTEQRAVLDPDFSIAGAGGSAAALPSANYAMTLGAGDFPPFFPPEITAMLSGDWELDLNAPRRYQIRLNGAVMVEGRYTPNPARLVLHDEAGPLACPSDLANAVYAWSINGGELHLSALQDRCDGRGFVLTAKPWAVQ